MHISNANKTSRKKEAVVQLISTLILPSIPPADGDMSKLTDAYFIKKEDAHELDYFCSLINPVLKTNLQLSLNCLNYANLNRCKLMLLNI
jgi:hypothetical protein